MEKVALITLGCAKNLVDSEVMLGYLDKEGFVLIPDPEEADIIIINTCGFIQPAREESLDAVRRSLELKKESRKKKIVVTGCYVQRDEKSLKKEFPEIDAWMGVNDFDKIAQKVRGEAFPSDSLCFLYDHASPRILSTPPPWTYVKISEGCSHRCSFCAIPQIKGPYRSRSISSVIEEIRELTSKGVKEINLVSQDSTSFGQDTRMRDGLTRLLENIIQIRELEWVRILYGYPERVTDSLIEIMREDKICSYLDLPFQHSDPCIIKRMKRGLDGSQALRLIEKIRKKLPDVALRTSLIVGFPDEGRKEFDGLYTFVKEARFDHLGLFIYSPEEGTECLPMGDPVDETEKKQRGEKIMELQADISSEINRKYVDRKIDVLIEGSIKQDFSILVGRGTFQAPEVDGYVFLPAERKVKTVVNSVQKVEITDSDVYDLYGRLIQ